MKLTLEQQYMLSVQAANTMLTDALVTFRARESAGMVLNPKARIFRLQHQKSYEDPESKGLRINNN